jgi:hypothetical protein
MHLQHSAGAAGAVTWRSRLLRLLCLAALAGGLMPVIDNSSLRHHTPIRSVETSYCFELSIASTSLLALTN